MNLFLSLAQVFNKFFPSFKLNLIYAGIKKDPRVYVAKAIQTAFIFFFTMLILLFVGFFILGLNQYYIPIIAAFFFSFLIFVSRVFTPSLKASKQIRDLERNLLPALQSVFVQLNSGIPLFDILRNVSRSDYGKVSKEFEKAVAKMSAGKSQIEALEEMVVENPSIYFRRAIWQILNGMKAGADLSRTLEESILLLSEEKLVQIQSYGARLSPLSMFYMLLGVILPALSIIFLILFVSLMSVAGGLARMIFIGFYVGILIFQIFFLGLINARRPSLV